MPGSLRVTELKFKSGARPGGANLVINPGQVLVFVGPNNSGKSLALREIENWCNGSNVTRQVVDEVLLDWPTDATTTENLMKEFESDAPPNHTTNAGHFWMSQHLFRQDATTRNNQVSADAIQKMFAATAKPTTKDNFLRTNLSAYFTVRLDGRTRFSLTDPKPLGDLQAPPQNHLAALFQNDVERSKVRVLTEEAFGIHFVIDPTNTGQARIRMSERAPASNEEEQGLHVAARQFHGTAPLVSELSDGVQAFVGLVASVMSLPHKIILLDEPEAFLHPPLARRLGQNLAKLTADRNASLMISTHSADFVVGALEAGVDVHVVRLTFESGIATAKELAAADVKLFLRSALLRSTGVIRALFHKSAVVCEADSDRAFYDEINRRLESANRGVRDSVFLNAPGKHAIHTLVGPLRRIGIPAAAIYDLDLLRDTGTAWSNVVSACHIPATEHTRIQTERDFVKNSFPTAATGQPDPMKAQGLSALTGAARTRADALVAELATYGLFLVPVGEVESWFSTYRIGKHGPPWLADMFDRIGNEGDANFVPAGTGDVWDFLESIGRWVMNPNRLGT